jgi:hypothetical protein
MRNNPTKKWQRNEAAAATNQPTQTTPKAGENQASEHPNTNTKPRSQAMQQYAQLQRVEHASDPERRAAEEQQKRSQSNKARTLRALAKATARFSQRCGAPINLQRGKMQVRPPAEIKKVSAKGQRAPRLTLGFHKPNETGAELQQCGACTSTCKRDKGKS